MTAPRETEILLDNIDIKPYVISLEGERAFSESVKSCKFDVVKTINNVITFNNDSGYKSLVIKRGVGSADKFIFRGVITNIVTTTYGYAIEAKNKYFLSQRSRINRNFDRNNSAEQGIGSEIFKTMVNTFTPLSCNDSTVVSTADLPRLQKFICNRSQVYERSDKISELYSFQHYFNDYDDLVYFEPKGFVESDIILRVGENVVNQPEWQRDWSKVTNSLVIEGATKSVQESLFFDGDNTQGQKFAFRFQPTSVKVYVGTGSFDPTGTGTKPSDNEANLRIGGVVGSTAGNFDYTYDDDPEVKELYFFDSTRGVQPSYTPPSGTKNIEVQYTYDAPTPIATVNQASIDTFGEVLEDSFPLQDVKDIEDVEQYAETYVNVFGFPFITSTLRVANEEDIRAGRSYVCIDEEKNINQKFVVLNHKFFYPYKPDELQVGDETYRMLDFSTNVYDRVRALEEKDSKSSDLLVQIYNYETDIIFENKYTKITNINIAGESLVWGHPTYGLWGQFKWGSAPTGSFILGHPTFGVLGTSELGEATGSTEAVVRLIQGQNTYKEYLEDDEFFDADRSDSGVSWTSTEIVIPVGKTLYTKSIEVNSERSSFVCTLGEVDLPGNLLFEITYDNINWITFTLGALVTFPEPSTDIRIRITNTHED